MPDFSRIKGIKVPSRLTYPRTPLRGLALLLAPLVTVATVPTTATAASTVTSDAAALTKRVETLENEIRGLRRLQEEAFVRSSESSSSVQSFLSDRLTIGGFFEPAFQAILSSGGQTRAAETSNALGLNFSAVFSSHLRFITQAITTLQFPLTNEHSDPRGRSIGLPGRREYGEPVSGSVVPQGFVEYHDTAAFVVQGGVGYVPFGIAAQLREPVLFYRRGGPQVVRTPDLITPIWSGIHLQSTLLTTYGTLTGHLYSFTPVISPRPDPDTGVPGGGARLQWASPDDDVRIGASSQVRKHLGNSEHALGIDAQWVRSAMVVTFEAVSTRLRGTTPWSVYLEPAVPLNAAGSVLLYFFGDYADASQNQTGTGPRAIDDPYRKWEYGAGLNWLPVSATRLRVGYARNDYVGSTAHPDGGASRDYHAVDLSAGVAF